MLNRVGAKVEDRKGVGGEVVMGDDRKRVVEEGGEGGRTEGGLGVTV